MTARSLLDRTGVLFGLVLVAAIFGLLVGRQFFAPANLELMARQTAIVCMAALGMTIVIALMLRAGFAPFAAAAAGVGSAAV